MNPYRTNARDLEDAGTIESPLPLAPLPLLSTLLACVLITLSGTTLAGCAFVQKHAKDALDVAEIACIIAHQFQPDQTVQQLCQIEDALYEPMKKILAESRAASEKAAQEEAESMRRAGCGNP